MVYVETCCVPRTIEQGMLEYYWLKGIVHTKIVTLRLRCDYDAGNVRLGCG